MTINDKMSDRAFTNSYEDYDGILKLFDFEKETLAPEIESVLRQYLFTLLEELERGLKCYGNFTDSSVYSGASGIALLYLRFVELKMTWESKGEKDFLKDAMAYIEPLLPHLEPKRFSFLSGVSGPLCVAAAVFQYKGMDVEAEDVARRCINLGEEVCRPLFPDDVMHGRAGFLYSMMFLEKHLPKDEFRQIIIKEIIQSIFESGKHLSRKFANTNNFPLYFDYRNKAYIGAAHGLCGIIHTLLQARQYFSEEEMKSLVRPTLDLFLELQTPSGNFPLSLDNPMDSLVHWCHGAVGCCHLLLYAYEVFEDDNEKYLEAAKRCGELIWEQGLLKKGCNICHGVAGNGYVFLRFFQATREIKYLHRAIKFAEWCFENTKRSSHTSETSTEKTDSTVLKNNSPLPKTDMPVANTILSESKPDSLPSDSDMSEPKTDAPESKSDSLFSKTGASISRTDMLFSKTGTPVSRSDMQVSKNDVPVSQTNTPVSKINTAASKTNTPVSLFEGLAGVVHFILDCLFPLQAGMPGFHL